MSLLLALLGFAALAGGTHRQAAMLWGTATPTWRRPLLAGGHALLAASLILACTGADRVRGLIQWFGDLTIAALLIVLLFWLAGRRAA